MRLAFSDKNGRDLLPMLKYSARAQLQLGALAALLLIIRVGV
jgi:ABC-type dipeptide/oligopeptide/nickel transport system permease subunit